VNGYSTDEVARILGVTPGQVRASVRTGLLEPARGPRGEYRFSFEHLAVLRTARGLLTARLPARRVRGTLEKLREQLPRGRRFTELKIGVEAGSITVHDGRARWQPESGQILLDFGPSESPRSPGEPPRQRFRAPAAVSSAENLYCRGCELESSKPEEAISAYRDALEANPEHADAHINLGRLLHESGNPGAAEEHYRRAIAARPDDPTAVFNLGVSLEDLGRFAEALEAYESALSLDPDSADAHWNAANLCERLGRPEDALGHLKEFRALTRGR
jgi:tetratricopeptide (TPR) repeat protein